MTTLSRSSERCDLDKHPDLPIASMFNPSLAPASPLGRLDYCSLTL